MTELSKVYMLDINARIDFEQTSAILKKGYSRIPVYEGERTNIVGLLFVKDLAFVDPEDETSLKTIVNFYNHSVYRVFDDTKLDEMLNQFKKGSCHMALVQRVNDSDETIDPFYEVIGIVTLEDVIEELIQTEIVDETDVYNDNTHLKVVRKPDDFQSFYTKSAKNAQMTPQMALAAFTFLWSEVEACGKKFLAKSALKSMIDGGKVREFGGDGSPNAEERQLVRSGVQTSSFFLVLQGKVQVKAGKEGFEFERGPFSHFCETVLQPVEGEWTPDYDVTFIGAGQVLIISQGMYINTIRLLEKMRAEAASRNVLAVDKPKDASQLVDTAIENAQFVDDAIAFDESTTAESTKVHIEEAGNDDDEMSL